MRMRTLRVLAGVLAAALSIAPAGAQDWAKANLAKSPRHGEFVTLNEAGGRKLQAWVVYPEVKEKAPVVVLIHEIFGESDWFREMADEIAGAGYIVIAPDLLSGYGPVGHADAGAALPMEALVPKCDPMNCGANGERAVARARPDGSVHLEMLPCDPAVCGTDGRVAAVPRVPRFLPAGYEQPEPASHDGMSLGVQNTGQAYVPMQPGGTSAFPDQGAVTRAVMSLPDAGVLADLDAAADYGKHLPSANGKLFVAGFCWGGGKSFLYATHRHDLSAAFVFYGPPPAPELMKNITAPVYGFYAGNDARISSTIPQTTEQMKAAGKVYDPVVYDGAGHGFMRAGEAPDASPENSAARQQGFRRLVKLLGGVR